MRQSIFWYKARLSAVVLDLNAAQPAGFDILDAMRHANVTTRDDFPTFENGSATSTESQTDL